MDRLKQRINGQYPFTGNCHWERHGYLDMLVDEDGVVHQTFGRTHAEDFDNKVYRAQYEYAAGVDE